MYKKLLDGATGNGRSTEYFEAPNDMEVRVLHLGTIGSASVAMEITTQENRSTYIPVGLTFASGSVLPQMLELRAGDRLYANQTGASGTTTTILVQ